MIPRLLGSLLVSLALIAPIGSDAQTAADTASIRSFYSEWFASLGQSPERYAGFYAADGVVLPPNQPPAIGRAEIAEWLRQYQAAAAFSMRPEGITVDEMRFLTHDWVVHRGTLRGQRTPRAGGAATPFETKYVDVLHRTAEGRWEVSYRMWSDNRP